MRKFYADLGWVQTAFSSDQYAVFQTAGVLLSLFPLGELAADAGVELVEPTAGFRGVTLAINVDRPEQVDAVMQVAETAGARVLRAPGDAFWGGRTAYFCDPELNLWEVAWNPTALFDERGAMLSF